MAKRASGKDGITSAGGEERPAIYTGRRDMKTLGVIPDAADGPAAGEACEAGCGHAPFPHVIVAGKFIVCTRDGCGHLARPLKTCGCDCHRTGPAQMQVST